MPRKYTRKTNRGQTPIDVLKRAAGALRQSGKLRKSAREFNVSKTTLSALSIRCQLMRIQQKSQATSVWVTGIAFFLQKWKKDLTNHIKSLSNIFYGLSTNKCRRLAFEFAMQNNITIPHNLNSRN